MVEAKSVVLKAPVGDGVPGPEHFEVKCTDVDTSRVPEGGVLLQALVFSADPYLRNLVRSNAAGSTMQGFIAGKVLESKSSAWAKGDLFAGSRPFTTVQMLNAEDLKEAQIWKLTDHISEDQISLGVGILGMPGSTAYGGFVDVLRPKQGDTLFVSGAAGAVGSLVGQIAKRVYGCTVIGSCGGPEKCELVKSKFGFDHAIDYKKIANTAELIQALKAVAPGGIDMYYENVGGMHFEAALATLKKHGRIAVCGSISTYNDGTPKPCAIDVGSLIYRYIRIEGFVCTEWLESGEYLAHMSKWWKEGKLQVEETKTKGIENWAEAFQGLFTGANKGKVVVEVA